VSVEPETWDKVVLLRETLSSPFQVEIKTGGLRFLADQSATVGGSGAAPDPYDLLCAAVGACTSMTVRLHADRHRWLLHRVKVSVAHLPVAPDGRESFHQTIALDGDLTATQQEQLLVIARLSPVLLALGCGCKIQTALGVVGEHREEARDGRG
jgi:uncharacterized OsmC-like protein